MVQLSRLARCLQYVQSVSFDVPLPSAKISREEVASQPVKQGIEFSAEDPACGSIGSNRNHPSGEPSKLTCMGVDLQRKASAIAQKTDEAFASLRSGGITSDRAASTDPNTSSSSAYSKLYPRPWIAKDVTFGLPIISVKDL